MSRRQRPARPVDDTPLAAAARATLGDAAVSGARSFAGSRLVVEVISFASTIVLARLLAPEQFGIVAIALIVPQLAEILAYEGFGSYLVRRPDATRRDAETVAALSISTGLVAAVVVAVVFGLGLGGLDPPQNDLLQLSALAFLLTGPGIVPFSLLQRQLSFHKLALVEARATVVGVVVSIALAALGVGAASLLIGQLARRASAWADAQIGQPLVLPRLHRERVREITSFGGYSSFAGLLHIARANVDYVIIGHRLSAADLGFYYRAYSLGIQYQGKIGLVLMRVAFPSYSRADGIDDMFRIRKRFARAQLCLLLPIIAAFIATAPVTIPLMFGERWEPAVVPAQILAVAAVARLIVSGTGPMVLAAGRPNVLMWSNGIALVTFGAAVLAVSPYGIVAVCVAVSAYEVLFSVVQTYVIVTRQFRQRSRELLYELVPPLLCVLPALALTPLVVAESDASVLVQLGMVAGVTAAMAVSYPLLLRAFAPATWADLSRTVSRFRSARAT